MSAPFVSGVAAAILTKNPEFSNEDVRQAIKISSDKVFNPQTDKFEFGRLNFEEALKVDSVLTATIKSPRQSDIWNSHSDPEFKIIGSAEGPNFASYQLFYSTLSTPLTWMPLTSVVLTPVHD